MPINKALNIFNLFEQSPENFAKNLVSRFSIGRRLLLINRVPFSISQIGIEQRLRHPETPGFFFTIFDRSSQSFD